MPIAAVVNNDMVGWANDHRLDATVRYSNPGLRDVQHAAAMQFTRLITYDALYYKNTDAAAFTDLYGDTRFSGIRTITSHTTSSRPSTTNSSARWRRRQRPR